MLFAAGFGTRMRELTESRPKPLVPVCGKPLLDHTLDLVHQVSPSRIVANTHYRAPQIAAHLNGSDVLLSHESPDILETGGGLRHALPLLGDGPVFTANTDAIWQGPNPFEVLKDAWQPDKMDALLICIPTESAVGHSGAGDFLLADDGRLSRGPGLIYGGIQITKTDGLKDIDQSAFSLNMLWDQIHSMGKLFGVPYPGKWCDVGSPEGIVQAEALLRSTNV
ncbi:MurNAc alpha-1-phosphate uridylyltransferase [Shimia gijangensis]|uniref:MurNAc alpha-1-phosphate uridylyltransferase n=2 Tax=Shimia gijangensis TaxID=1470563 RepID=A0A1M6MTM9_9RHOB|nr:MurNAc alpha-1-phosphate uridylyltransferase [Shimia gijangensis]